MKKSILFHMIVVCALVSCSSSTKSYDLENFPMEADPRVVGERIANKFLVTPHTYFGNPKSVKSSDHITYPDACAWLGALWFSKATYDEKMTLRLKDRFEPLFAEESHLLPRGDHAACNVLGAVPLEIYLQNQGDQRYLKLGESYAENQWKAPGSIYFEQKISAGDEPLWQARTQIDDMFMIATLQSQAYRATGQRKYIDPAANRIAQYIEAMQQPNGLFFHSPEAPFFWGRSNGWMAAAMAELLATLPVDNLDYQVIMGAYLKMMSALRQHQGGDGMWNQLIDEPSSWNETSSTAMFAYAVIVGVKRGWLDKKRYGTVVRKAWIALAGYIDENDEVTDVCEMTDAKNDKNYYMSRKRIAGDLHAQGPLLWCASELLSPF